MKRFFLLAATCSLFLLSGCGKIHSSDPIPSSDSPLAGEKREEFSCSSITDFPLRNEHFNACIVRSIQSCENIEYASIANEKLDVSYCDSITDDRLKSACKENLFMSIAMKKQDTTECQKIENRQLQQTCITNLILFQATTKKSLKLCDAISDIPQQKSCKDTILNAQAKSELGIGPCLQGSRENVDTCRNQVYFLRGIGGKNTNECQKINKDEPLKHQCLDSLFSLQANEEANPKICAQISDPTKRVACSDSATMSLAISSGKKEVCRSIGEEALQQKCEKGFARTSTE